jgi:hypothetical protein
MSDLSPLQKSPVAVGVKELDESIWQAWKAKNALRERQAAAAWLMTAKCASLGVLLATTILWKYLSPYEVAMRFALAVGALVVAGQAWRLRRYGFAALFAAITVIYNPVVAAFPMTGGWPAALVFLTVLAFAASLIWLRGQPTGDPGFRSTQKKAAPVKTDVAAWETEGGALVQPELELAGDERKGARK